MVTKFLNCLIAGEIVIYYNKAKEEVAVMANEEKKDFNAMLHKDTGMPKVQIVTDEATIKKYGGEKCILLRRRRMTRL